MFSELENIEWIKLKQAHGSSENIPDAIKGLVSENL